MSEEVQAVKNTENALKEPFQREQIVPEIEAAKFLHGALPAFRVQLDRVTGTQAKRVLSALTESPFEQTVPGFTTQEAKNLFDLGLMIANAKFVLFNVALKDHEISKSVEESAKEAGKNANNSGEDKND